MSSIHNFTLQIAFSSRYDENLELVEAETLLNPGSDHTILLGNVSNIQMLYMKDSQEKQIKNDISFCRPKLDWLTDKITQYIFQFLNANELKAIVFSSKPLAYHVISDQALKKKFLFSFPAHITLFSRRNTHALKRYASHEKLLALADTHLKMTKVSMDRAQFVRPLKISKKFEHLSKESSIRIATPKNKEDECSKILCHSCCIIS